jgi:hypothetical protein
VADIFQKPNSLSVSNAQSRKLLNLLHEVLGDKATE